jgi:hypothetical protein
MVFSVSAAERWSLMEQRCLSPNDYRSSNQLGDRWNEVGGVPSRRREDHGAMGQARRTAAHGRLLLDVLTLVNGAFLKAGGTSDQYRAGIERAIASGWLWLHESGTYVKFTPAGAELFA